MTKVVTNLLEQYPVERSAVVEVFCICGVQCGSHQSHAAAEHLNHGWCD